MFGKKTQRVYLDWAAATPLCTEAFLAMEPFLKNAYGNPGAIHKEGVFAKQAVEKARGEVAKALQVRPEFVTFTGGGTEANNLTIFGLVKQLNDAGRAYGDMEVVSTKIEHPSVTKAIEYLTKLGVTVKYVGVDAFGKIILSELKELLSSKTVLVSCSYVNSEIGTIQSLHAIKKVIKETEKENDSEIYLHVDAAQAPLWINCQFDSIGADFLTMDAAKCRGPKGVGLLVQSKRANLSPTSFGGGQENALRPGTENVAGIVGAGIAFRLAQKDWKICLEKVSQVRDEGIRHILENIPTAVLNGATDKERVANNINISIPGLDTEFAAIVLDKEGFAVSTKSACAGASGGESLVVKEMSGDEERALSTLRFTLGPDTSLEQLKNLTKCLKVHVEKMTDMKSDKF